MNDVTVFSLSSHFMLYCNSLRIVSFQKLFSFFFILHLYYCPHVKILYNMTVRTYFLSWFTFTYNWLTYEVAQELRLLLITTEIFHVITGDKF